MYHKPIAIVKPYIESLPIIKSLVNSSKEEIFGIIFDLIRRVEILNDEINEEENLFFKGQLIMRKWFWIRNKLN